VAISERSWASSVSVVQLIIGSWLVVLVVKYFVGALLLLLVVPPLNFVAFVMLDDVDADGLMEDDSNRLEMELLTW